MSVAIVDYGSGNLRSAAKAFARASLELGRSEEIGVTSEAVALKRASRIVLPGVGAFDDCKRALESLPGMWQALDEEVRQRGKPFLGICLGMQLMASRGLEGGRHEGLGWIEGEVVPLAPRDPSLKVPHMGWNELVFEAGAHPLLEGLQPGDHAYFVHGFHFVPKEEAMRLASVDYGGPLAAMIAKDNMAGVQFHPEKSQAVGLKLIANFLRWRP